MTKVGFEPATSRLPNIPGRSPRGVGKATTAGKPVVDILDIKKTVLPLLSKNLNKIDQNFSGAIQ